MATKTEQVEICRGPLGQIFVVERLVSVGVELINEKNRLQKELMSAHRTNERLAEIRLALEVKDREHGNKKIELESQIRDLQLNVNLLTTRNDKLETELELTKNVLQKKRDQMVEFADELRSASKDEKKRARVDDNADE